MNNYIEKFALLFLSMLALANAYGQTSSSPNVVLILADDLGFSDLQSYGSEISTPSINTLARSGIRFTNYHTAASCAPTRAMLMTGVSSHRAGLGNMPESIPAEFRSAPAYGGALRDNVATVAEMLLGAGYHTYMAGKWHLGKEPHQLPFARGFERSFSMADTGADNWEQKPYLPIYEKSNWFEDGQPTQLPDNFYSSKNLIDKTIEYIDSNVEDGRPFFSYVAFQAVHIPVQAPREYTEKYMDHYVDGWSELRQQRYAGAVREGVIRADTVMEKMHTTVEWDSLSMEEKRFEAKSMAVYAGMIDAMDFHLGRLLNHLREIDEYDNTVFIFLSDNGAEPSDILAGSAGTAGGSYFRYWMNSVGYNDDYETLGEVGSYNMIGPSFASAAAAPLSYYKFFTGEGGMRVPLIISGLPTTLGGKTSDAFTFATDLVPTILDIANVEQPNGVFDGRSVEPIIGKSLVGLVSGEANSVYEPDEAVGFELGGNFALFKGDYKIAKNRGPVGDNQWHLFNINSDPGESNDLAEEYPDRLAEMIADYENYAANNLVLDMPEDYDQRTQVARDMMTGLISQILFAVVALLLLVIGLVIYLRRRFLAKKVAA